MVSDDLLVRKSQNGDLEAFEILVSRYERQVYTIAYRFMGNHEDASDLAQEAFIKAFKTISSFRGDASFKTWLYHITANVCRDELRKRQRRPTVSLDEPVDLGDSTLNRQTADWSYCPERVYEVKEEQEFIQSLINSLPGEYRLVLIMRELLDFTYEEIAAHLDCSLGTVKSRLNRGRKYLRERIISGREHISGEKRQIR